MCNVIFPGGRLRLGPRFGHGKKERLELYLMLSMSARSVPSPLGTKRYTTNLKVLEVGFMMGCVISPLLFIICTEMLPRVARDVAEGEVLDGGIVLPAMKAFMKNVAKLIESKSCI